MPLDRIFSEISSRCPKLRTGIDIGFADVGVSETLRSRFHGLWMTVVTGAPSAQASERLAAGTLHRMGADGTLPFDGNQFDVAVLNGAIITSGIVREVHRVLRPAGFLLLSVEELVRRGPDCTLSKLYNAFLKSGYDIVSVSRPPWWHFGRDGKALTICARKKNWHEHRALKFIGSEMRG